MKAKVGLYHFGRWYNNWGIFVYDKVTEGSTVSSRVKCVGSYEEAVKEVYRLNGWGEPKRIIKNY